MTSGPRGSRFPGFLTWCEELAPGGGAASPLHSLGSRALRPLYLSWLQEQETGMEQGWSWDYMTPVPGGKVCPDSRRFLQGMAQPPPGLELRGCSVLK